MQQFSQPELPHFQHVLLKTYLYTNLCNRESLVLVNDLSDQLPVMLCTDCHPWTYSKPPLASRRLINKSAISQFQVSQSNTDWIDQCCPARGPHAARRLISSGPPVLAKFFT